MNFPLSVRHQRPDHQVRVRVCDGYGGIRNRRIRGIPYQPIQFAGQVLSMEDGGTEPGRSARLREFLLYIVRYELEGKTGEISEQNIGERVFARRENYSPVDDNIVRVSARQLRLKLKEFYDSDGAR